MVCYARQSNLLKPSGGISGVSLSCIATPAGFLFGDNTMKPCNTCLADKPETEFYIYAHRGTRRARCKLCDNAARDLRRKANLKADSAKVLAAYGVRTGVIKKEHICSNCNQEKPLHKHHEDYGKPYDVIWLCVPCHNQLHAAKRRMKHEQLS